MKKSIFIVLLAMMATNIFGLCCEKNGINFAWKNYGGSVYVVQGGRPYFLTVINSSQDSIEIDSSVISAPLVSYTEARKQLTTNFSRASALMGILCLTAAGCGIAFRESKPSRLIFAFAMLVGMTDISLLSYKLMTLDDFKKEMLDGPVVLKPGETIKKVFWLKNPKDHVAINFQEIKILK